jgi:CheY-like chemotaxis protein
MIRIEDDLQKNLKIINADPGQIEQVLMNISINAKHAMPEGGRLAFKTEMVVLDQAYCDIHLGATPGEYVLLTISDTGHGMDEETLKHIFDPFFTTKETGEGTGLGLAMVYGIVKNHGGYIMCYTEKQQGTVFRIYFPVLETESITTAASEKEEEIPVGTETILLVDDEAPARLMGKNMLERFGYTTVTAQNGEEALQVYASMGKEIDLVILDMGMPGMGGGQCLRALRGMNPKAKVILSSGHPLTGQMRDTLNEDADPATGEDPAIDEIPFIGKPYQLDKILKSVRAVLDNKFLIG